MKKTENEKVIFCKRCLYSSKHPLGITFNDQGICSGCEIHDEKYTLNWKYRWSKLVKITKEYKSKKNNYDCIVPISGAQDSYFTIHVIKKLGLNPLLVHYNKYFNTAVGIENLANLRIKFNYLLLPYLKLILGPLNQSSIAFKELKTNISGYSIPQVLNLAALLYTYP